MRCHCMLLHSRAKSKYSYSTSGIVVYDFQSRLDASNSRRGQNRLEICIFRTLLLWVFHDLSALPSSLCVGCRISRFGPESAMTTRLSNYNSECELVSGGGKRQRYRVFKLHNLQIGLVSQVVYFGPEQRDASACLNET